MTSRLRAVHAYNSAIHPIYRVKFAESPHPPPHRRQTDARRRAVRGRLHRASASGSSARLDFTLPHPSPPKPQLHMRVSAPPKACERLYFHLITASAMAPSRRAAPQTRGGLYGHDEKEAAMAPPMRACGELAHPPPQPPRGEAAPLQRH
jgi:hypothetical protein